MFLAAYIGISVIYGLFIKDAVTATIFSDMTLAIAGLFYCERCNFREEPCVTKTLAVTVTVLFILVWLGSQLTASVWYAYLGDSGLDSRSDAISESSRALYAVMTIIIAPICEEVLIRGIMFNHFKDIMPAAAAGILSSFVFALMHGSAIYIVIGMMFGLFVTLVYQMTGNLTGAIAVHCLYNFIAFFSEHISLPESFFSIPFVVSIDAVVIAGLILVYGEYNKHKYLS